MNLLLLETGDFIDQHTVLIDDWRFEHCRDILKTCAGDSLSVGLLNGHTGRGVCTEIDRQHMRLHIARLTDTPPPALPLVIVLALPRPNMLKRIVRNIAELGIKQLHLIHSQRVEKSYWQSPAVQDKKLHEQLKLGLMQAKDTMMPEVHRHYRFRPFVEDILPGLINGREAFLAHPGGDKQLEHSDQQRLLVIGPEGGFTAPEVALVEQQGVQIVTMGQRIYRVENALTLLSGLSGT